MSRPIVSHRCHAAGCKEEVPARLLMCAYHWRMVDKPLQAAVYYNYRQGQEIDKQPSSEYLDAAKAAVRCVALKEGR